MADGIGNLTDALALMTAYQHGAGDELIGQLMSESDERSTWYEAPEIDLEDDELTQGLKKMQQSFGVMVAKTERLTALLSGMLTLSQTLLANWAQAIDCEPAEILEAVGQQIAEMET